MRHNPNAGSDLPAEAPATPELSAGTGASDPETTSDRTDPAGAGPRAEYDARLAARRATLALLDARDARFSSLRLLVFGLAVLIAVLAWRGTLHGAWLIVPAIGFLVLVIRHDRTIRARDAAADAVTFYERALARLDDRWIGTGETGDRFRDDEHLYANDLDLFGTGSLFQLLSIARTPAGEETLAAWLKALAGRDELRARQDAVRELRPRLDLREDLALAGRGVRTGVHSEALVAWAERPTPLRSRALRSVAVVLTLLALVSLVLLVRGIYLPALAVLVAGGLLRHWQGTQLEDVLHSATGYVRDLAILRHVLERLDQEHFTSPRLAALHARIESPAAPASRDIRRLERLVEAHDWEHNLIFTPIAVLLLWSTHIAWAVEDWRRAHGPKVREWLDAVGEFEAFSSLATYTFEHPADPFPDLLPGPTAVLDGTALGHPLLPVARAVRNDVTLGAATRLLVVSGSNMSGKSTMLRTVGINAVLAFTGAPVRAQRLSLSPFAIGATLRIQDSLLEGRSRFYAEITRVRTVVDAGRRGPLLFLLDELFHGTNSHDRVVGAAGVLRSLLDQEAIGLVTTHDLALTAIADRLGSQAANVHFDDRFVGGEMQFDYRMKPGPVTRSNALALMRAVGLDVPEDETPQDAALHRPDPQQA